MKIIYQRTVEDSIYVMRQAVAQANLPVGVSVGQSGPSSMKIKISKLGTSTLSFFIERAPCFTIFELVKKEIAFMHKAHINAVETEIIKLVVSSGGTVE